MFMGSDAVLEGIRGRLSLWSRFLALPHTVFALPFGLGMLVLCSERFAVSLTDFVAIVVCVISARSAAMSCNRIVDREIDAKNTRTKQRELPAGEISLSEAVILFLCSSVVFFLFSTIIGWHCTLFAGPVLAVLCLYSFAKRFTSQVHLLLGFALALAPGGVWYAITAEWSWLPIPLMVAVMAWVAGFDILYSCQDETFDRDHGLFSIPARYGVKRAFLFSRILHLCAVFFLVLFGVAWGVSAFYYVFVALFALLLVWQHRLLSPADLSRIDAAFFTANGCASMLFLIATLVEVAVV
ncbi:putative 4-hydroxybenzoate polyprenyltransferase [bacterium]|nr:putative 4-hydroxybenzoate polyprenyltransferase [bacterium]